MTGHMNRLKIVSEYDQEIPQSQTADSKGGNLFLQLIILSIDQFALYL